jgi:hypothetical protein
MMTASKNSFVSSAFALLACLTYESNALADNFPSIKVANTSQEKVCVIGYSLAHPAGADPTTDPAVPAYYLQLPGAWQQVPQGSPFPTIVATEVTPTLAPIPTAPDNPPFSFINGASLTFYYGPTDCGQITYYALDSNVDVEKVFKYIATNIQDHRKLIVDTSNVDSIQGLLEITVIDSAGYVAKLGNQVTTTPAPAATVTPLSAIVERFNGWLDAQPEPAGPDDQISAFKVLASASLGPYQSIESPNDYIGAKCTQATTVPVADPTKDAPRYPNACVNDGEFVHFRDPLNSYYENRLSHFFTKTSVNLKLWADAQGSYPQGAWLVTDSHARCPIFPNPGDLSSTTDKSLHLVFQSSPAGDMILCNPANQVAFLGEGAVTQVTQATNASTATITLTADAVATIHGLPNNGVGYNIGQPETNWVGLINTVTGQQVTAALQNSSCDFTQQPCPSNCNNSNSTFSNNWYVSNIPFAGLTIPYETRFQMVFSNDGVFSPYVDFYAAPLNIIYESIARNIVQYFSHGIENCVGVTSVDENCVNVKRLADSYYLPGVPDTASANWSVQTNWYPEKGSQSYYAQYLHTDGAEPPATAFWLPNGQLDINPSPPPYGVAASNQGAKMAMTYAFGFDENPTYLDSNGVGMTPYLAQVPPKLDPIPAGWLPLQSCGPAPQVCGLTVTVGPRCPAADLPCPSE